MEASTLPRPAPLGFAQRIDWNAVWIWLLGFGLIVYLGLDGGGYDPLVHDQVGIAVWWILFATLLVGALPRRRPSPLAWCALGLFVAFVAWTAMSLTWTESVEKTSADLARVATYLGVFALALFARGSKGTRRMVAAVGTGIVVVSVIALLSRLHPAWFPEAAQTGGFLSGAQERLSYPLNYWNGLAALVAIGLPLMLQVATCAKTTLLRALAAAALPAMVLASFFTLSRGGSAAAIVALVVFLALTSDRLPKLLTMLVAGAGGAILIAAATQRDALMHGLLTPVARDQGNEMLAMTLVVCGGVALVQAGLSLALVHRMRPRWSFVSRRWSFGVATTAVVLALCAAAVFDAPGRLSSTWTDFKQPGGLSGASAARLVTVTGNGRYQLWVSASEENQTRPLTGTGASTFEYWWARNGSLPGFVQDTHSLYMQTLGELGIVGLVLLAGFLLAILVGGTRRILRAARRGRPQLAAALAGCAALYTSAAVDWTWQLPVVPIAFLLLASVLVTAGGRSRSAVSSLPLPLRGILAAVSLAAIVAIAIPLSASTLVRQSQDYARSEDLPAALRTARSAQNAQPGAATPRLQQALLLEAQRNLSAAALAARDATERESTNWRTWLVLSRIEAERGRAAPAVRAYRKAKSLNPRSSLFAE